ncbi:hypothetical protein F2Q69_00040258 [Brassica cretica]|uniref:Uncharacterized protein n=1 Tax=Brassica cretica TaxID=69181 RepID=A0A8S9ND79_BRACR|nr:hypothetical protein F2Q69_00040258 [Brassica cretica]
MLLNFDDVSAGLSESEVRFRLIGLELLMIDEHGFISSNWVVRYQANLNCGTIYRLMNFFATKANTSIYRVVDHNLTIRFTHSSVLSELLDNPVVIQRDWFRFHSFQEFEANYPQSLNEHAVLDEVDDGWQHSAVKEFYSKFNESLAAPAALLVTTVNTKHIGAQCPQYRVGAEISAYDYDEKGTFVLLGNVGPELIGRQAVMATWVLAMRCQLHNSRSSTLGAVNVCNTAIGGTCST